MAHHIPAFTQHLERYVFAMPYCDGKKVLDAGCKDGFGGHLLSYAANHLTMADISPSFLKQAEKHYKYFCPVEFTLRDFNHAFPDGLFDVVVAFEIIEHVDDPDKFVRDAVDHLYPGGLLVFSVPHMMPCKEHKTLFDWDSIEALASKYLDLQFLDTHHAHPFTHEPLYRGGRNYLGVAKKRVV